VRRCALITLLSLFTVTLVTACSDPKPIERAAQGGKTGVQEDTQEPAVLATTSGAPSERGATVGVASATEQSEAAAVAEAPVEVPMQPASETGTAVSEETPFVASPQASGGAGYGADDILGVRYGIHEGYERVVVDFGTGEEPAWSVPDWTLSSPTGDGILRVALPSVSMTSVSDGTFGGPLLKDFHVVRAPEGGMFVDIFAESAFTYRVLELSNPARLVVDFKPSDASLDFPLPAEAANTVLTQPRSGARVGGSLMVSGYSRNPEATNTITLTDARGETLVQQTVMSNDWTSTWGYFETTLDLPAFSGQGTLKVGAQSARDGTFQGVEIPVYGN
jgi:hypothetical protein